MNYRRRSGSLIQEQCDFLPETGITQSMAFEALKYLREQDPNFNEREAGAAWAEAEADKVAEEYVQRAEDLGLYKRDENAPARGQQGSDYGRSRYGSSALDQIREANKAHWEESQRLKKEAEGKAERERVRQLKAAKDQNSEQASTEGASEGGQESTSSSQSRDIAVQQPVQKAWLQPVERKPWVKYYEEQATILKENTVPQMSLLRRLGPSALVTLLIIGSCMFLSDNYVPPPKSARMFPDTPPSVATLGALTAAYLAVFIGWRMPPLWRFFNTYFTASPGYPYALSMIGSTFAHQEMLHEDVGRGTFLAILLGCGVTSSFYSLAYNVFRQRWMIYTFGSSNAVYGIISATCLLRGEHDVKVFGYDTPVTGLMFLGAFGGWQLFRTTRGWRSGIDFAGHWAGIATGVLSAYYVRRRAAKTEMVRVENPEKMQPQTEA
ncbi:hypothetical protein H2203_004168 [Taxawa tesnikishii (nom. ined.)]|nr:hypothetical protein H2203_004168 [Dothideales sp. JES 119]